MGDTRYIKMLGKLRTLFLERVMNHSKFFELQIMKQKIFLNTYKIESVRDILFFMCSVKHKYVCLGLFGVEIEIDFYPLLQKTSLMIICPHCTSLHRHNSHHTYLSDDSDIVFLCRKCEKLVTVHTSVVGSGHRCLEVTSLDNS